MQTLIKKRDDKKISFKLCWMRDQIFRLRKIYSKDVLSDEELKKILIKEYNEKDNKIGRLYNNISHISEALTVEEFINLYLNNNYTLTSYNVLFKNQLEYDSILLTAIRNLLDIRKSYKNEMMKYPENSEEHTYYNLLQLAFKLLANSLYGIFSMSSALIFNSYVQNSITLSGRRFISTAIYLAESLFGDNERFRNTNELIEFISNTLKDKYEHDILDFLPEISADDLKYRLRNNLMNPEDYNETIDRIIDNLTAEERTKVYAKNNLKFILSSTYFQLRLRRFNDMKDYEQVEDLIPKILEFGQYNYIDYSQYERVIMQSRKISLVTDTDSTFVNFGYVIKLINNILKINNERFNFNILNFCIDLISQGLRRYLWTATSNMGIPEDYRSIMNLKNEYVYQRLITTENKKNYAGWLMSHFGKRLSDEENKLDIKGLAIRKTVISPNLRAKFQDWLIKDFLLPEKISVKKILEDYNDIENFVEKSLEKGNTEFLIPMNVDTFDTYAIPDRQEQVRGTIVWNALEPNNSIQPPAKVFIIKTTGITEDSPGFEYMKEHEKAKYNKLMKRVFHPNDEEPIKFADKGVSVIALPYDLDEIPDYIKPLVDADSMKFSAMRNANPLLKSVGCKCDDDSATKQNYKSNIIEL